jgi:glucose/arabinose dehydrogenase
MGYRVEFVPFTGSRPVGSYESFARGMLGEGATAVPRRPLGVALGPDGSLYISEDAGGRIWRVMYTGR